MKKMLWFYVVIIGLLATMMDVGAIQLVGEDLSTVSSSGSFFDYASWPWYVKLFVWILILGAIVTAAINFGIPFVLSAGLYVFYLAGHLIALFFAIVCRPFLVLGKMAPIFRAKIAEIEANGRGTGFSGEWVAHIVSTIDPRPAFRLGFGLKSGFSPSINQGYQSAVATPVSNTNQSTAGNGLATFDIRSTNINFSKICGMSELKAELRAALSAHATAGKNGILLTGEPGNGKTLIAEALAGELGWRFMPISSELTSRWIGQTTEQVQKAFRDAINNQPIVLFFDEFDSYAKDRANANPGENSETTKVVNAFLTGLVDVRRTTKVLVVAATNHPELLDPAIVRTERFDFTIEIKNPDLAARQGLMNQFLSKGLSLDKEVRDRIARRWEGFSVARIRGAMEWVSEAVKKAGSADVDFDDLMLAMRKTQPAGGVTLPENTPSIAELTFDANFQKRLSTLSTRLIRIDEIEEMGGTVPKGVIFQGPPGTGKTMVAKALAKDSRWTLLTVNGSDLLASNGQGWDAMIKKARSIRPCIVFIDEAEGVMMNREVNPHGALVTNKLLATLEGVTPLHDVLFIGATNTSLDELDPAITRGGRFSEFFEFSNPDEDAVTGIVKKFIKSKPSTKFAADFRPEAISVLMAGESPANINDRLQQAINQAVGRYINGQGSKEVSLQDLRDVLAQVA